MKTHNIPIEGLPDGWKAVAYRVPKRDELIFLEAHIQMCNWNIRTYDECVIVEKIQPCRIVLEETDQNVPVGSMVPVSDCPVLVMCTDKIWRVKEE